MALFNPCLIFAVIVHVKEKYIAKKVHLHKQSKTGSSRQADNAGRRAGWIVVPTLSPNIFAAATNGTNIHTKAYSVY